MTFDSVAREIVSNSIRSAICIDDEYVEPYQSKTDNVHDMEKPRKLMESFRKSNCSLDVYTYQGYEKLSKRDADYVFKNRDLLILDWQLTSDQIKFKDTLLILKDAAENPGLGFVVIYTWQQDLDIIELNIRSFFNNNNSSQSHSDNRYEELISRLDQEFFDRENGNMEIDDAETFLEHKRVKELISDLTMRGREPFSKKIKTFEGEIRKLFGDQKIGREFLDQFEKVLKELYGSKNLFGGCEQIEFRNRTSYIRDIPYASPPYCYKNHDRDHALWVNNTYITIFKKGEPEPESVYKSLSDQLCKKPGNIMALIALEMKNNFRENSVKIGKDLLSIDELAFFHLYDKDKSQDKEEFYEFLRNNWKHQVAAFHLNSDSRVFEVLPAYIKEEEIDKKLKDFRERNKDTFHKELAELNFLYSFHHQTKKKGDHIRFGDIFSVHNSKEAEETKTYLLIITAHCDCLRPKKINYNYHLVIGSRQDALRTPLKNATDDKGAFSFFKADGKPISIEWITKPFTAFIPEEKRIISPGVPFEIRINGERKYLVYKGTMLENYTQRIANKSFAQAGRVGIDLAEL